MKVTEMTIRKGLLGLALVLSLAGGVGFAKATSTHCPICTATGKTFAEEIESMDVSVIAKLVKLPPKVDEKSDELPRARFEIVEILNPNGKQHAKAGDQFETLYFGSGQVGATFLVWGVEPPVINWATPLPISEHGQEYLKASLKLPKEGGERLAFFQNYLEDKEEMIARDAYDEFAKAPYDALKALKPKMNHDQIVANIKNKDIPTSRRRLYLVMLCVCGSDADLPLLEEMITSTEPQSRTALDALVAAYLTLKGAEGLPLIEKHFLDNKDAQYSDIYATIMALRFHGTEGGVIEKKRVVESLRLVLKNPKLADLIIPDLARFGDWESLETLVTLFKEADDKTNWVRMPVVNYLRACPLPRAKEALAELEKIDPATIERAKSFFPFVGPDSTTAPATTPAAAPTTSTSKCSYHEIFVPDIAKPLGFHC